MYSPELEERIFAARNDPAAYLIYADWLQSHGDPLGELVVVQHALRHHPSISGSPFSRVVDPPGGRRAPSLVNKDELDLAELELGARWYSTWVAPVAHAPALVRLRWRMGFIAAASFRITEALYDGKKTNRVLEFLDLPAARLLRALRLSQMQNGDEQFFPLLVQSGVRRSIEALVIRSEYYAYRNTPKKKLQLAALSSAFPRLRSLRFFTFLNLDFTGLRLPELTMFEVRIRPEGTEQAWGEFSSVELPKLRVLSLEAAYQNRAFTGLEALLARDDFRQLKRLHLRGMAPGERIVSVIAASPMLRRLELLDLTDTMIGEGGARTILFHAERFRHLRQLVVSPLNIGSETFRELRAIGPQVFSRFEFSGKREPVTVR